MKVTVQLSDSELRDVCRVTGERKKGPAVRKLVVDALAMRRREKVAANFVSGRWGVGLEAFESARASDRAASKAAGRRTE